MIIQKSINCLKPTTKKGAYRISDLSSTLESTKLKHQGFDLFDIAAVLGHRNIKNTLVYIHLEKTCFPNGVDDYTSKAAKTEAEALSLIEAGFEYICDFDGDKLFRKRK